MGIYLSNALPTRKAICSSALLSPSKVWGSEADADCMGPTTIAVPDKEGTAEEDAVDSVLLSVVDGVTVEDVVGVAEDVEDDVEVGVVEVLVGVEDVVGGVQVDVEDVVGGVQVLVVVGVQVVVGV
jgi:hypothetical protein